MQIFDVIIFFELRTVKQKTVIFSRPPLIAYKRDTNIRDMLVRSKLRQPATRTPRTTPCNQEKCKTCPFICTNISIKGLKSNMNITKQFNCLVMFILDFGPLMLALVQMKGHVLHFSWSQGVVHGGWLPKFRSH